MNYKPNELLEKYENINVCAPMVRYSKLPFRELVASYNCQITTTPMMLSKEFSKSEYARAADFSTSNSERGTFKLKPKLPKGARISDVDDGNNKDNEDIVRGCLIAQFAANDPIHLSQAAELISPYVDGIDLNCGCPQPWAIDEGIGSALLRQPELVKDIIKITHDRVGNILPVSFKIRVDSDDRWVYSNAFKKKILLMIC